MTSPCRSTHSLEPLLRHSSLILRWFNFSVLGLGVPLNTPWGGALQILVMNWWLNVLLLSPILRTIFNLNHKKLKSLNYKCLVCNQSSRTSRASSQIGFRMVIKLIDWQLLLTNIFLNEPIFCCSFRLWWQKASQFSWWSSVVWREILQLNRLTALQS